MAMLEELNSFFEQIKTNDYVPTPTDFKKLTSDEIGREQSLSVLLGLFAKQQKKTLTPEQQRNIHKSLIALIKHWNIDIKKGTLLHLLLTKKKLPEETLLHYLDITQTYQSHGLFYPENPSDKSKRGQYLQRLSWQRPLLYSSILQAPLLKANYLKWILLVGAIGGLLLTVCTLMVTGTWLALLTPAFIHLVFSTSQIIFATISLLATSTLAALAGALISVPVWLTIGVVAKVAAMFIENTLRFLFSSSYNLFHTYNQAKLATGNSDTMNMVSKPWATLLNHLPWKHFTRYYTHPVSLLRDALTPLQAPVTIIESVAFLGLAIVQAINGPRKAVWPMLQHSVAHFVRGCVDIVAAPIIFLKILSRGTQSLVNKIGSPSLAAKKLLAQTKKIPSSPIEVEIPDVVATRETLLPAAASRSEKAFFAVAQTHYRYKAYSKNHLIRPSGDRVPIPDAEKTNWNSLRNSFVTLKSADDIEKAANKYSCLF